MQGWVTRPRGTENPFSPKISPKCSLPHETGGSGVLASSACLSPAPLKHPQILQRGYGACRAVGFGVFFFPKRAEKGYKKLNQLAELPQEASTAAEETCVCSDAGKRNESRTLVLNPPQKKGPEGLTQTPQLDAGSRTAANSVTCATAKKKSTF